MEVIYGPKHSDSMKGPMGVGLGNFDGLHIGHMALINTLLSESQLNNLGSLVYTFTKHPENIMRKRLFTPLITTVNKKIDILKHTRLDYLYFDEFTEEFSRLEPEEFVKKILVKKLNARLVVAGFNYRFGYKGQGDMELLKRLGTLYGFKVITIPPIKTDDDIVSSTAIRQGLAAGDIERVFKMLGRHYSITGEIVGGRHIGNTIGFPTANILPEEYLILPKAGTYITKTMLNEKLYQSVTNIGVNPTFGDLKRSCVETHLLDFADNIYGQNIEVFFLKRLRGERKFKTRDELVKQIGKDIIKTREYFQLTPKG